MRWVLSPVIGSGTSDDPYRAKASAYGGHVTIIPGNWDGTPKFNWCLCRIKDEAVAAASADPDLTVFPDLALDDVLTLAQRNWLITKVSNLGKPTGWIVAGITVREALRTIGRYIDANFDVDLMRLG